MRIFKTKTPPATGIKKKEKPRRTKSRWFYQDSFYEDEERKKWERDDIDFRAYMRNKF